MSYILEALKKSQRERELGEVPTLESEPFESPPTPATPPSFWLPAIAVLSVLGLVTALYAVLSQKSVEPVSDAVLDTPPPAQVTAPAEPVSASAEPEETALAVRSSTQQQQQLPEQKNQTALAPVVEQRIHSEPATPDKEEQAVAVDRDQGHSIPESQRAKELTEMKSQYSRMLDREQALQARTPSSPAPPAEANLPEYAPAATGTENTDLPLVHQLPADIASQLPELRISLYYYTSNAAERFVILNSRKQMQGGQVPPGILVKEIRKDGLVLEFSDHVFFKPR